MAKSQQINARISKDKLKDLLDVFNSLSKINDVIRFKKESDQLLIYSLIGPDNAVHAFKFYELQFDDFFKLDIDINELDFIITDVKKLSKQLQFYLTSDNTINILFNTIDGTDLGSNTNLVRQCSVSNDVFESFIVAGEPFAIRNLTLSSIKDRVEPSIRNYGFELKLDDFQQIKKLINLDSTNDALNFTIDNNIVKAHEKRWKLKIATVEIDNQTISFHKKFISHAEELDIIQVDVYDTFVVFRGTNSVLMLTLELKEYKSY